MIIRPQDGTLNDESVLTVGMGVEPGEKGGLDVVSSWAV